MNEINDFVYKTIVEYLALAHELVAFDDVGELWRIKVIERNTNGTPAPATYQCAVDRDAHDVRCAFVDKAGRVLVTMRAARPGWTGNVSAGDILQWRYTGTTIY
jgi:hypothetical protein